MTDCGERGAGGNERNGRRWGVGRGGIKEKCQRFFCYYYYYHCQNLQYSISIAIIIMFNSIVTLFCFATTSINSFKKSLIAIILTE